MPLLQPPRDAQGRVIPHDHAGIDASDGVIRRVSEQQVVIDEKTGGKRLSSMVFRASSGLNGGMSIDLQTQIEDAGLDARMFVTTPRWIGSLRFEAGALRTASFQVGFDPLPENPHHGEVWGTFSRSNQQKLRELCQWFVLIPGVEIS
ncbi:MAG: hypothetical protein ACKVP5_04975 [Aestuariivirga sp.]